MVSNFVSLERPLYLWSVHCIFGASMIKRRLCKGALYFPTDAPKIQWTHQRYHGRSKDTKLDTIWEQKGLCSNYSFSSFPFCLSAFGQLFPSLTYLLTYSLTHWVRNLQIIMTWLQCEEFKSLQFFNLGLEAYSWSLNPESCNSCNSFCLGSASV